MLNHLEISEWVVTLGCVWDTHQAVFQISKYTKAKRDAPPWAKVWLTWAKEWREMQLSCNPLYQPVSVFHSSLQWTNHLRVYKIRQTLEPTDEYSCNEIAVQPWFTSLVPQTSALPLRDFKCAWFGVCIFFFLAWLFFVVGGECSAFPNYSKSKKEGKRLKYFKKGKKNARNTRRPRQTQSEAW